MRRLPLAVVLALGVLLSGGCDDELEFDVVLRNQDSQPTHLLFKDETLNSYNKVEPGQSRSSPFTCTLFSEGSRVFQVRVRAGRNGAILGSDEHIDECADSMSRLWVFTWTGSGWVFQGG